MDRVCHLGKVEGSDDLETTVTCGLNCNNPAVGYFWGDYSFNMLFQVPEVGR